MNLIERCFIDAKSEAERNKLFLFSAEIYAQLARLDPTYYAPMIDHVAAARDETRIIGALFSLLLILAICYDYLALYNELRENEDLQAMARLLRALSPPSVREKLSEKLPTSPAQFAANWNIPLLNAVYGSMRPVRVSAEGASSEQRLEWEEWHNVRLLREHRAAYSYGTCNPRCLHVV